MQCKICGTKLSDDLFAAVTGEKVCSICKIKRIGGLQVTEEIIEAARNRLELREGEFLSQDNVKEAARILGRD